MKDGELKVYLPKGAKINLDNKDLPPPEVEYENRKHNFDINAVKDVTEGQYGKKED